MELSYLEIVSAVVLVLLFSKRILQLSLSVLVTSSTIVVSLLALSFSVLILAIAAVPTLIVGCKIAENMYADSPTPLIVKSWCGSKPKIVRSRSVELYQPRVRPTAAPGKY